MVAVSSAGEALQILQTTTIDLLLSDVGMPEMNGYELMREVRQLVERHPKTSTPVALVNLPAITLTAYAEAIDQQQALAFGFQQHLVKPVEPNELSQAIVTVTGKNQMVQTHFNLARLKCQFLMLYAAIRKFTRSVSFCSFLP